MTMPFDKSKVRILITDDEASLRGMLSESLRDEGWSVEVAENGKLGFERLGKEKFHIILSDINMPEMTGIQFLEAVKKDHPLVEFVIMTSHATLETAMQAISLGAYDYLTKPFDDLGIVSKKMNQVAEKILLRQQNAELIKRLKKGSQDLKRLFEFTTLLMGVLDEDNLRVMALKGLQNILQDPSLRSAWCEKDGQRWLIKCQTDPKIFEEDAFEGVMADYLQTRQDLRSIKTLELTVPGQNERIIVYEAVAPELVALWAHEVRLCFDKVLRHLEMVNLAHRDGLTKLYNHRYFQDRLRQDIALVKRQQADLSLIICDVDHFKKYNDQHGHPEGDELLRQLAGIFEENNTKRDSDIVCRYGGEEFVFILPFTDYEGALIKADKVRAAVEAFPFAHREQQPLGKVTMSVGVASFPKHAVSAPALVEMADKALYQAKHRGRNRVVGCEDLQGDRADAAAATESAKPKVKLEAVLAEKDPVVEETPAVAEAAAETDVADVAVTETAAETDAPAVTETPAVAATPAVAEIAVEEPAVVVPPVELKAPASVEPQVAVSVNAETLAPVVEPTTPVVEAAITEALAEAPAADFSEDATRPSMKRKAIGPEVDVDPLLQSLDALLDSAGASEIDLEKAFVVEEPSKTAREKLLEKKSEVKRETGTEG